MMQYPPLTQFGQTNLAKLHLSLYYHGNYQDDGRFLATWHRGLETVIEKSHRGN